MTKPLTRAEWLEYLDTTWKKSLHEAWDKEWNDMNAEPSAWAYQNANTEQQYLVWHKQTGGRNWMPLFTLTDVQEAILAEREAIAQALDKQADLACDEIDRQWAQEMAAAVRARGDK